MELVSLIIMVLGLVALVAIYVISRVSRRNLPQKRDETVPVLRNADGEEVSSVLDDVPAKDGKRPSPNAREMSDVMMSNVAGKTGGTSTSGASGQPKNAVVLPPQLVLFIAAEAGDGFAGDEVLKALDNAGLAFGEMGIFHRVILTEQGETNLFGVANGVKPWTLVPEELVEQSTPGLSMILNLPSPINDNDAIHDFLRTAERLTADLSGVLKNHEQQPVTPEVRADLLALAA
ncbi:MAG: cell division protein ZipA C-terminal FtsZ-binding domain-containing protein [Gammaproteobacteria bacterium]|nr:cell division protein ZipA C-terminal FtsZ-binding domain-containing protein [Gammaproteobacteria bacterium]MBU1724527.1 cell division protein ZipA C-terminal FtsZ-binding domain-containing protein [Gammaproteobacteria bacterium]MBU2004570.1 cell division protein ZipA C-terminal FtsZ-binding domain-containing protein [Gammaproteobacteria bacterium]